MCVYIYTHTHTHITHPQRKRPPLFGSTQVVKFSH